MTTIREEWEQYERAVVPQNASPVQRVECRKAFYGGILVVMTRLIRLVDSNSSKETLDMIESMTIELATFLLELQSWSLRR
jgi:hypothetical protein